MATLKLLFKYAKKYEKEGIVKIIEPHNATKDDDVVEIVTIDYGGRRSGKTAKLKELLNKSLDKSNKILYK